MAEKTPTKAGAGSAPKAPIYSKEDQVLIKRLVAADRELSGTESAEELITMGQALDLEEAKGDDSKQEEIEGVPNFLPIRYEVKNKGGKQVNFPIHFVAAVKDGYALYGHTGQRISGRFKIGEKIGPEVDSPLGTVHINKMAAKNNAMRWQSALPGDFK